ncbi:MAG: hypothetical protein CSA95_08140 [Bacteroidetes bacterium]|nr:MAG: hypothetical protein CSA95_08140 [Bacteroidota bacterium]PIE87752.1 MAG: hypothetical protein CSA04_05395 [Bacteroidota bacterium]
MKQHQKPGKLLLFLQSRQINFPVKGAIFTFLIALLAVSSCKKPALENPGENARLAFSSDTLLFDTLFTTIGSVTKQLKIYNPYSGELHIDKIMLAGGEASPYQINLDGEAGVLFEDVRIPAEDSLFLFVRVTIDPTHENTPLIVSDSLLFFTHNHTQKVKLVSWGQDAHYIVADHHPTNGLPPYKIIAGENEHIRWENDKPYVIYGYAVVDSAGTLEIDPGVTIHIHAKGGVWVYKGGAIAVNGTLEEPVTFQGDRLGEAYDDLPGQWDRILINEGPTDNYFNHTIIKNAFIGIQAEPLREYTGNTLVLNNTKILNATGIGLYTKAYRVRAANSVFGNCGSCTAALTLGGDYDFRHCTFATFYGYNARKDPALLLNNYGIDENENPVPVDLVNAYFGNCIIYGSLEKELGFDLIDLAQSTYQFDHCLIKTSEMIDTEPQFIACLLNENPYFADSTQNFYPDTLISSAINKGNMQVINTSGIDISTDIKGESRISDEAPDLGAYEFY